MLTCLSLEYFTGDRPIKQVNIQIEQSSIVCGGAFGYNDDIAYPHHHERGEFKC
jgi:hypothetical protein